MFNRCREEVGGGGGGRRGGGGGGEGGGAKAGKVRRVSGSLGRGEHVEQCQNHTHICCSSRTFPISL